MSLIDLALNACGFDPNQRIGWAHGAPLSMWVAFGSVVALAASTLAIGVTMG